MEFEKKKPLSPLLVSAVSTFICPFGFLSKFRKENKDTFVHWFFKHHNIMYIRKL